MKKICIQLGSHIWFCTIILIFVILRSSANEVNNLHPRHHCPSICRLNEESTNCGAIQSTKQYSNHTEICKNHLQNQFKSELNCELKCKYCKVSTMISKCSPRKLQEKYEMCKKKPETGLCKAYFVMWYYNEKLKECRTFVYGGCGGNANKFEDHLSCLRRCGLLPYINGKK